MKLRLHETYSRQDVHSIFAPDTIFTKQSGTWGLHGIVSIPKRPKDFVFFVTFGQKQGSHTFDEGITDEGVLSWQSQPSMGLASPKTKQLIDHDDLTNVIHLFLRTDGKRKYTYLGPIKYISHDYQRERPVYFQWQVLAWPIPETVQKEMGLHLDKSGDLPINIASQTDDITTADNESPLRTGVSTRKFQVRKIADYGERDAKNRELGLAGEKFALQYEKDRLRAVGLGELADKVRHISVIEGDGAGYDILSYNSDGSESYIEVKTTQGHIHTSMYMSSNEVAFANSHSAKYKIYRIYDFDMQNRTGEVGILLGSPEDNFALVPTNFELRVKSESLM